MEGSLVYAGWVLGQGSEAAGFEDFVRRYGERAFQFAYRLTDNIEEAKDLVQESFYRVLRNWDKYDSSQPLEAWFFTILRHLFLDGRRRHGRRYSISLDNACVREGEDEIGYGDLLPHQEEAVLDMLQRRESAQTVRRALDSLNYEYKAALTLCDMEGLSYEEISRVLEVPVGTVRSRISRARAALREKLARDLEIKR